MTAALGGGTGIAVRLLAAVPALLALCPAQTVVTVDGGGSGNFTQISTAIARVASGTVIRVLGGATGTYEPFTVQNKSVTILGVPAANQPNQRPAVLTPSNGKGPVQIGPLRRSDRVVIQGLLFELRGTVTGAGFQVVGVRGSLAIEDAPAGSPALLLAGLRTAWLDIAGVSGPLLVEPLVLSPARAPAQIPFTIPQGTPVGLRGVHSVRGAGGRDPLGDQRGRDHRPLARQRGVTCYPADLPSRDPTCAHHSL